MATQSGHSKLWVVVLAGGHGTRLREYARTTLGTALPKQFCSLYGAATLLQRTVSRMNKLTAPEHIVITVPHAYVDIAAGQLADLSPRFAIEPCNRDTTAAVFLALLHVYQICPDAVVAVVPSDHYVSPEESLLSSVLRAEALASANEDRIIVIGCRPSNRDADLGFVVPAAGYRSRRPLDGLRVARVVEKPTQTECSQLIDAGAYWNTFIMVASVRAFLSAGHDTVPHILGNLGQLLPFIGSPDEQAVGTNAFCTIPISSFTRDVLGGVPERLLLLPLEEPCHWMDLGRRERVEQVLQFMSTGGLPGLGGAQATTPSVTQGQF